CAHAPSLRAHGRGRRRGGSLPHREPGRDRADDLCRRRAALHQRRPRYELQLMHRRTFCTTTLAALATPAFAAEPPRDVTAVEDFDELWRTLKERYCYFGEKRTDWDRVRAMYRPLAIAAQDAPTDAPFIDVVRCVLNELY